MTAMSHPLEFGMVGGGRGAFIGAVHRTAACLDGFAQCVAGCLSSTPDKARESGADWGFSKDRNYPTWEAMLEGERSRAPGDRVDWVSIVTPNHVHFPVARAFAEAGFNVVCDKPMVITVEQARELIQVVRKSGVVFAVTYNYSGYPLVKQAREMVKAGEIGEIRKVVVEYNQGWLAGKLEATGQKQAEWRTDPARSGAGGAIGDIGSHAEQLASYVTGLEIDAMCADLTSFVDGRQLDDDANLLLRFRARSGPPAKGVLIASQVEVGHENDLRIRVHGTKGTLVWQQEEPNRLLVRREGAPDSVYRRANAYLGDAAKANTRIPPGHPEAFLEAFANVYRNAMDAMRARSRGAATVGGSGSGGPFDYPDVIDGARGVSFIASTKASAASDRKWTPATFSA